MQKETRYSKSVFPGFTAALLRISARQGSKGMTDKYDATVPIENDDWWCVEYFALCTAKDVTSLTHYSMLVAKSYSDGEKREEERWMARTDQRTYSTAQAVTCFDDRFGLAAADYNST